MRNHCGFSIEAVIRATGLGSMGRAATRGLALVLAVAVLLAPAIAAAKCSLGRVARFPVTMDGLRASVPVLINGTPTRLWLDSGAFFNFMPAARAAELGLKTRAMPDDFFVDGFGGSAMVRAATVKSFGIADATIKNVDFLVGGTDVGNGLIGLNLLAAYDADYDLANGTVDLMLARDCAKVNLAYWAGDKLLSVIDLLPGSDSLDNHIYSRGQINGKNVRLMFDTGAETTVLMRSAADRLGIDLSAPGVVASGEMGGIGRKRRQSWIVKLATFNIGDESIQNTPIRVIDETAEVGQGDVVLGADFFLAHHILVAASQRNIYLTYNGGPIFSLTTERETVNAVTRSENMGGAEATAAPVNAADFARRGAARLARHDTAGAIADLSEAIRRDPKVAQYFRDRAYAWGAKGDTAAELADFDAAIELAPEDPQLRVARGVTRADRNDLPGARADAEAAAKLVPQGAIANLGLVQLFERVNQPGRSIVLLGPMIDLHRRDPAVGEMLDARCWARGLADIELELALADCQDAIRHDGPKPEYLDSRALIRVRQKDFAAAIADYDAALKTWPDAASSMYMRGWAQRAAGDTVRGAADMTTAAKLDPEVRQRFQPYGFAD